MSADELPQVNGPGRAMTPKDVFDGGLVLMELGIPVFPIGLEKLETKIQKRPLLAEGHKSGTTDPDVFKQQIREALADEADGFWPITDKEELGFGVWPGPAGIIVNDYDTKNGGVGGEQLEQHRARYGEAVERCCYQSISGATNVIFVSPDPGREMANTSPWPDVDVRSSSGWIVPPGVFCSWGQWEWTNGDWEDLDEQATMPAEMFGQLLEASETTSEPAADPQVNEWLDANRLTWIQSDIQDKKLANFVKDLGTAGSRNPVLKDALDWVKRENQHIDRRGAFAAIDTAWRKRMEKDGETKRLNDAWDVLGRVVGYDIAWNAERDANTTAEQLQASAPPGIEVGELTAQEVLALHTYTTKELDNIPAPVALVQNYLVRDSIAWAIGESGVGKSFVGIDISLLMATGGGEWHGNKVEAGKVLYIAAEGLSGIKARAAAWAKYHGREIGDDMHWLGMAVQIAQVDWALAVAEYVADGGYDMIVIDTLARSTVGAEENSASEAGQIIYNLDNIRVKSGACVLLIHHMGKNASLGGRGSSAFKGALESELMITGSTTSTIKVETTKQKNLEEPPPIFFKTEKVRLGGIGPDGEEAGSIVLIPSTSEEAEDERDPEASRDVADRAHRERGKVLDALMRRHPEELSGSGIRGELARKNVSLGPAKIKEALSVLEAEGFTHSKIGRYNAQLNGLTVLGLDNRNVQ